MYCPPSSATKTKVNKLDIATKENIFRDIFGTSRQYSYYDTDNNTAIENNPTNTNEDYIDRVLSGIDISIPPTLNNQFTHTTKNLRDNETNNSTFSSCESTNDTLLQNTSTQSSLSLTNINNNKTQKSRRNVISPTDTTLSNKDTELMIKQVSDTESITTDTPETSPIKPNFEKQQQEPTYVSNSSPKKYNLEKIVTNKVNGSSSNTFVNPGNAKYSNTKKPLLKPLNLKFQSSSSSLSTQFNNNSTTVIPKSNASSSGGNTNSTSKLKSPMHNIMGGLFNRSSSASSHSSLVNSPTTPLFGGSGQNASNTNSPQRNPFSYDTLNAGNNDNGASTESGFPNSKNTTDGINTNTPSFGARTLSLGSNTLKHMASSIQQKSGSSNGKNLSQHSSSSTLNLNFMNSATNASNNPFSFTIANNDQSTTSEGLRSRSSAPYIAHYHSNNTHHHSHFKRITSSTSLHSNYSNNVNTAPSTPISSSAGGGKRQNSISSAGKIFPSHNTALYATSSMKRPQVYPAILSRVASRFYRNIPVGEHKKDGLVYRDSFTGQEAVDVLCSIIRTSDRNLALLLGRALDAQKLFHDVFYEHRLRDSANEVYEFANPKTKTTNINNLGSVVVNAELATRELLSSGSSFNLLSSPTTNTATTTTTTTTNNNINANSRSASSTSTISNSSDMLDAFNTSTDYIGNKVKNGRSTIKPFNINGVFILLAECYSPTCTRDKLCYSISCPRRLEQQARLKPNTMYMNNSHFNTNNNISSSSGTAIATTTTTTNTNNNISTVTGGRSKSVTTIGSGAIKSGQLKRNVTVVDDDDDSDPKSSWTSSVPKEVWADLDKHEIKRQEAIYEFYMTEKNFIKSLETIRDTIIKTLAETNIIPADIRKNFIKHVFAHVNDIYSVNKRFLESLTERVKSSAIIDGIGDILLKWIPFFEPFVLYIASRPYAKYLIETQRTVNPYFARFDEDLMNSKLRHGIDSFLSQGVSRPGRYALLCREIIKYSKDNVEHKRDLEHLNRAMDAFNDFMKRIDKASGAAQDRHDVILLKQRILFKNEFVNLRLNDEKRRIRHEGLLSRKEVNSRSDLVSVGGNSGGNGFYDGDIQFYLLDNVLLFLKSKAVNKWQQHKVFQRPIPLQLLFAAPGEDIPNLRKYIGSSPGCASCCFVQSQESLTHSASNHNTSAIAIGGGGGGVSSSISSGNSTPLTPLGDSSDVALIHNSTNSNAIGSKNALTFIYYGAKQRYQVTLYAAQYAALQTLLDKIRQEQHRILTQNHIFNVKKVTNRFFDYNNRINSVCTFDGGRNLLIATTSGLYVFHRVNHRGSGNGDKPRNQPQRIMSKSNITQVSVLEDFKTVLLLIDKKLYSCPIKLLYDTGASIANKGASSGRPGGVKDGQYLKRYSKELMNHVSFFKDGDCGGKKLIVTANSSQHSIKFFELEHPLMKKSGSSTSSATTNKKVIEVYFDSEPISISFLKNNLCIGCKKGFQIVSPSQVVHEPLLDPADTSLEFALPRKGDVTLRPMSVYRVGNFFFLCYSEFAFFVNSQGWKRKDSPIIQWEGIPNKFAIWYPYILAFDSSFIEIRKIDDNGNCCGELVRCVLGEKIRLLQTSSQEILYVYEDDKGYDTIASLDFWIK
ncbi:Rho family guanine nucleotide exchange factor ROM2 SCDLUD_004220 [Saccharomycodes ludwigii]|uniref:Rho family guanine nucleotide exchange factor ROM2 n=1 Tax=Saccharomycodes ludwigii TaxID=36035 RepID=UPI001E8867B5|nr:hypothetical protein SCDLUD_004220 [Saccharomycodes ludwigii]KAH3899908.1 hypothetical protein SCDLUD_004220 [Saccharomycodes ludwigii]